MLELEDLRRTYGDVVALDGCSFTVEPGQVFGFVGSNGAGKTTAMRIVMGVDRADGGQVRWRGRPVDREARRRFGYMPEERGLYPKMGCARQLRYLSMIHGMERAAADRAARSWLEHLGLGDRADDPVEKLSLGNQQRAQLAAALVHEPDLLVLDEPFSGLDPVGTDTMSELLLERAAQGVPVVFSSHQLDLVERLCDAVAIIDRGRITATGSVEALRTEGRHRRLRVVVEGAPPGWADGLSGVAAEQVGGDACTLVLDHGVDEQAVLDRARACGRVTHFGFVRPTLAELYRAVVTGGADDGEVAA